MIRGFAGLAVVVAVFAAKGDNVPAKLIDVPMLVNGSFEDGPELAEVLKALDAGSREMPGWIVTRGQIDFLGLHWQHAHGRRSLDLHGSPGIGGVKQTFATRTGQRYRVTFSMAGNPQPNTGPVVKTIAVRAAGDEARFTFDTTGKDLKNMGWQTQTWEFVADSSETTLEIYSPMTEGPFAGPALDDVRVVPVR